MSELHKNVTLSKYDEEDDSLENYFEGMGDDEYMEKVTKLTEKVEAKKRLRKEIERNAMLSDKDKAF